MHLLGILKFACFAAVLLATQVSSQAVDTVVAANYAPLMIAGNETQPGYAVEVIQEAARRAGRAVDITFMPFERAMFALRSETNVLMPALFYGKRNNDQFQWIVQIQRAKLRFATTVAPVDSLDAARALGRIAVESGTTADAMLTELGFGNLMRTVSPQSSGQMLAAGRVDAWLQDESTTRQVWDQLRVEDPLVLGFIAREVPIFLVASTALRDDIAAAYRDQVENMRADGTLDRLWDTYTVPVN